MTIPDKLKSKYLIQEVKKELEREFDVDLEISKIYLRDGKYADLFCHNDRVSLLVVVNTSVSMDVTGKIKLEANEVKKHHGKIIFTKSTIDNFSKKQSKNSTRALGWDTGNGNQENKIANLFSDDAFGHTGFTGTSIWIDPTIDLYIILLTNRTYEMTNRSLIKEFRPLIHDYIIECIIKN